MAPLKVSIAVLLSSVLMVVEVMGQTGLSEAEKEEILDFHNFLRSQVDPTASNMEIMVQAVVKELELI